MIYLKFFVIILLFVCLSACNVITPTSPVINSFTASPPSITSGGSSTLSWSVTDADTLSINQGIGTVTGTSVTVYPTATTTYILTATNSAGSVTETFTVNVGSAYGSIDINSSPTGAKVYLDGEDTGQVTPIVLTNITIGNHVLELRKFHYKGWEDTVTVMAGQTVYFNPPLEWAPEESMTLQSDAFEGKDALIYDDPPIYNGGSDPYLHVGTYVGAPNFTKIARGYLQFDLDSIPPGAVITEANLGLCYWGTWGGPSISIGLYEVTESWVENSITWNNQPTSSGDAIDIQIIPKKETNDFVYWQITNLVKGWYEENIANYGIVLRDTDESSIDDIKCFYSSENYDRPLIRPKLIITFYVP